MLLPVIVPKESLAQPTYRFATYVKADSRSIDPSNLLSFKLLSYADDLKVFLSSPGEWQYLQDILNYYSLASNSKVNIQKTEMVSLPGLHSNEWSSIALAASVSYHTSTYSGAVRYLGYPLYSSSQQLASFLEKTRVKISNMHTF